MADGTLLRGVDLHPWVVLGRSHTDGEQRHTSTDSNAIPEHSDLHEQLSRTLATTSVSGDTQRQPSGMNLQEARDSECSEQHTGRDVRPRGRQRVVAGANAGPADDRDVVSAESRLSVLFGRTQHFPDPLDMDLGFVPPL
jgi:hypothetical protein